MNEYHYKLKFFDDPLLKYGVMRGGNFEEAKERLHRRLEKKEKRHLCERIYWKEDYRKEKQHV